MNFFQRALKNITRKKTKAILLLVTFFVIGNFVIVGLGVSQAAQSAKTLTRQKMRAVVTMRLDYEKIYAYLDTLTDQDEIDKFWQHSPQITLKDVQGLLEDPDVKTANAISTTMIYEVDKDVLDYVHLNNDAENNGGSGTSCYMDENGNNICNEYVEPHFLMKANYFPDMIEFADKMYTMVDGRFYTQEEIDKSANVVLISEALAAHNGLKVGDHISFTPVDPNMMTPGGMYDGVLELSDVQLDMEIIGIYNHNSPVTPDAPNYKWLSPYENPDNLLLAPATTINGAQLKMAQAYFTSAAEKFPEDEYYSNPENYPTAENNTFINDVTFLLDDPMKVDSFVAKHSATTNEFLTISANNEEFQRLSKPLDTLSLYANIIVWLVVVNAIVIITLITALTLKTREYEIGVLLSIGASKVKVVAQFFVELAIVAVLGFTLSIISGSLIANKVGQQVLQYQVTSSGVDQEDGSGSYDYVSVWDNDYSTDVTLDDIVSQYQVTVSPLIIGEIYIVGLGIVFISTIIPSLMIMRFNPKQILMNQN